MEFGINKDLNEGQFRCLPGVKGSSLEKMVAILSNKHQEKKSKRGQKE